MILVIVWWLAGWGQHTTAAVDNTTVAVLIEGSSNITGLID
jgi:hypothetical protein